MHESNNTGLGRFVREASQAVKVKTPEQVFAYLRQYVYTPWEDFEQEELWTLLLNTRHQITHEALVARGTVNFAPIRPAEIFRAAIRCNAVGLVVAHNHPSNEPAPSNDDISCTRRLAESATLLGFDLHDHIIVCRQEWASIRELGHLP